MTLEDLRQEGAREYRTEPTGAYTTNRNGRRIPVTRPVEYVTTVTGETMTLSAWTEKAIEAVGIEGKENLLSGIIDYVKDHCAWIHSEKERLVYALDCLTDKAYMKWDDFWKTTEGR